MTLKRKVRTLAVALSRTTSKSDSRLETLYSYYGSSDWVILSGTNWCDCGALKLHADELPPALQDNCVWLQNDQYTAASINHKRPSTLSELVGYCPFWWPPPRTGSGAVNWCAVIHTSIPALSTLSSFTYVAREACISRGRCCTWVNLFFKKINFYAKRSQDPLDRFLPVSTIWYLIVDCRFAPPPLFRWLNWRCNGNQF